MGISELEESLSALFRSYYVQMALKEGLAETALEVCCIARQPGNRKEELNFNDYCNVR